MAKLSQRNPWENATHDFKKTLKGSTDYLKGVNDLFEGLSQRRLLPSQFQVNDRVKLDFFKEGTVTGCKIIKIHFSESKVLYDVEISSTYKNKPDEKWSTRLYNVDSNFVKPIK